MTRDPRSRYEVSRGSLGVKNGFRKVVEPIINGQHDWSVANISSSGGKVIFDYTGPNEQREQLKSYLEARILEAFNVEEEDFRRPAIKYRNIETDQQIRARKIRQARNPRNY